MDHRPTWDELFMQQAVWLAKRSTCIHRKIGCGSVVSAQEDKQIQMGGVNVRRKAKQLPVFVYGTLLEGFGNWQHFLKGKTERVVTGELAGHKMYAVAGFPGIVPGYLIDRVYGELMYVQPDLYEDVLRDVDRLEGYRGPELHKGYSESRKPKLSGQYHMYVRERVQVKDECGNIVEAWTYIWNRAPRGPEIGNGCYDDFVKSQKYFA